MVFCHKFVPSYLNPIMILFNSYEQLIQINPEVDEYKLAYAQVCMSGIRLAYPFCSVVG